MTNCMACSAAVILLAFTVQGQRPSSESTAQTKQTVTGCLRATKVETGKPDEKRVVYTLEVAERDAKDRAKATYQLSTTESVSLAKHVGQRVELQGDLLQPPGLPPAAQTTPLPADSEGTFRVTRVKMISAKCPNQP